MKKDVAPGKSLVQRLDDSGLVYTDSVKNQETVATIFFSVKSPKFNLKFGLKACF